jgi:hypothetical protein
MDTHTTLDSTIFWQSTDEEHLATPYRPHMRSLQIGFNMLSPFGAWYFTGPEDPEDTDYAEAGSDPDDYYLDYSRTN